jgi:hypothetical protein
MPIVQNAAVFTACAHDQADRPAVLTTANANPDSDAPPPKSDGKAKERRNATTVRGSIRHSLSVIARPTSRSMTATTVPPRSNS